jgi:phosphatidate cytidylyltransferase
MLKLRIITALTLLLFLLPALFYPSPEPFCALVLLLVAAGVWEWGRINGRGHGVSISLAALNVLACVAVWLGGGLSTVQPSLWIGVTVFWVLAGGWLLYRGVSVWARIPVWFRLLAGWLLLLGAWIAMAQARIIGINFLLSAMALVWMADISAYFAGKAWGGRWSRSRLAPTISPGKSWEGVWGGMMGVVLVAFVWRWVDQTASFASPSLFSHLAGRGLWFMVLAVLCMAALSVVGDLIESLIKRSAGVKDSSHLLPGHGGVLDRLDALLPTLPLTMMLYSLS